MSLLLHPREGDGTTTPPPPVVEPDPSIYPLQLGLFTSDLYQAMLPVAHADPTTGYPLREFLLAAAYNLDEITFWVRDQGEQPGWALFMDPDQVPGVGLRWLGQLTGTYIKARSILETQAQWEAAARAKIKDLSNFRRGSVATIVNTAKQFLTGGKTVILAERNGSAYHYTIIVYDSEAPQDIAPMLAALTAAKPAGLTFDLNVVPGQTYDQVKARFVDYDAVETTYTDYIEVRDDEP